MEEMIENGYGNLTFRSEGIRQGEYIERKKGELEKGTWGSSSASIEMVRREGTGQVGENCEEEKGQMAGDRALSRHLAEANRMKRKGQFGEKVGAGTWRKKGRRISRLEKMSMSS